MPDLIRALAYNMIDRKRSGTEPYNLFLGAGASISSGCSSMKKIVNDLLQSHDSTKFAEWGEIIAKATSVDEEYGMLKNIEIDKQKRVRFFEIWNGLDRDSKYSILTKHLLKENSPSKGYEHLANLIKMGYINIVFSTNLDNLLEKALINAGWYPPNDFVVIVNQRDKPEEVREQLESSRNIFKLVKLHGALESPISYAFTPEDVFDFEKSIKPTLSQILNQSLVVVGHNMQDRDIDMLFDEEGKEIHYVKPTPPEIESRMDTILKVRKQGSIIDGEYGNFDNFFTKLWSYIEKESKKNVNSDPTHSIEGFLRSIGYNHELQVPRSRFRNLPTLYVKPSEYKDICSKLEKEHVVFIIGEPHLGKTYTAFHLLWEYYQKDYETFHIRHDKLVTLLHKHDNNLNNVLLDLFGSEKGLPRIIHFDDPFGETLERRTDVFAKEMDTFLDYIHGYEHLRVIVTTRLNIFREAIAETYDLKKVEKLEKDIRVHTSYSHDILLDILHRYIRFYKPIWADDKKIIAILEEKLPDLLPAPHNIEFFVRTSEKLNSLEDVLKHVENSKEMIKALGNWMASLPTHEQFFLLWVEVCSTTSILFPESQVSKIDFERIYRETLAFMYKKQYIDAIPASSFSRTKNRFDMILLESRDSNKLVSYDFVHPSYHEALWYTIQEKSSFYKCWELLKNNIADLFEDFYNIIDLVQLNMIERYGTINRDLDQLLLLSAESNDEKEKLIALGHMLKHPDKFVNATQFIRCIPLVNQSTEAVKFDYLRMVDKYFDNLHSEVLMVLMPLLFDSNRDIRISAEKVVVKYLDYLPETIKQHDIMKGWYELIELLYPSKEYITEHTSDVITELFEKEKIIKLKNSGYILSENIFLQKSVLSIYPTNRNFIKSNRLHDISIEDYLNLNYRNNIPFKNPKTHKILESLFLNFSSRKSRYNWSERRLF